MSGHFPVCTGTALFAARPQPCLRRPTFSVLPEKVGKKRRWIRIGLYRSVTELPRRRTLWPAHGTLSTKLNYSAACVETTLPSEAVATQEDGKTRCCGNNSAPTYAPVVHNIRKGGQNRPPKHGFGYVCRGRCPHRPLQGAVHERDWPSISEMSRNKICCCLSATACSTFVGSISYRENRNFAPVRAFRPRSGQKFARVSAQYRTRPQRLFSPHSFLARQKRMGPRSDSCGATASMAVR